MQKNFMLLHFQVLCFSSFFLTSELVVTYPIPVGSNQRLRPWHAKFFSPAWTENTFHLLDNCEHKYADRTEVLLLDLWRHAGQRLCFLVLSLELLNTDALDSCQVSFSLALLFLLYYRYTISTFVEVSTEQPTLSCSWISQLFLEKLVLFRH